MIATEKKEWTYEEYYKIDDGNQYQVMKGELIMVPAPSTDHQRFSRYIEFILYNYIKKLALGEVFNAPIDLILDDKIVVQPDLVFISKEKANIIKKRGIFGVPDLIVEIISKSSIKMDRQEKFKLYEKYGVKEYWIADPNNKTIECFFLENSKYEIFCYADEKDNILKSKLLDGLEVNLNDIFTFEEDDD